MGSNILFNVSERGNILPRFAFRHVHTKINNPHIARTPYNINTVEVWSDNVLVLSSVWI
jgi:hypothetical protein